MGNILIVDDRAINREYLHTLLNYVGHHVIEAEDGLQGLEALRQQRHVDLIITDILMPHMNGYEFVRKLKKEPKFEEIPILFYTATYRKAEAQMLAEDLGVTYVLAKPAEPKAILDVVNRAFSPVSDSPSQATSRLTGNTNLPEKLQKINNILDLSIEEPEYTLEAISAQLLEDNEHDNLIAKYRQLYQGYNQTKNFSRKLFILLELSLELMLEKDINKLLRLFCQGAKKLIGAEHAFAGIFNNEGELIHLQISSESDKKESIEKQTLNVDHPFIKQILKKTCAFHDNHVTEEISRQIPFYQKSIKSFLAAPFLTSSHVYGFICFLNKDPPGSFSAEDINLIDMLSAEIAILYENIDLYNLIQNHAANLQIEIGKHRETQELLRKNEMMFRQFAENIDEVFFRFSPQFDELTYVSPAYEKVWGLKSQDLYTKPSGWMQIVAPEDKGRLLKEIGMLQQKHGSLDTKFRIIRNENDIRHIHLKVSCLKNEKDGTLSSVIGFASDITDIVVRQHRNEIKRKVTKILSKAQSLNDATPFLLELLQDVTTCQCCELWLVDKTDNVLRNVDVWHDKTKPFHQFAAVSKEFSFKFNEGLPGKVWKENQPVFLSDFSINPKYPRARYAATINFKNALGFPINYQDEVLGVVAFFDEKIVPPNEEIIQTLMMVGKKIGEFMHQKYSEEQLSHLAKYDILTGLMNKSAIEDFLNIKLNNQPGESLAVIILGIDRFNLINEAFGYDIGDSVLSMFAKRLEKINHHVKVVSFRLSGGKFGIVPLNLGNNKELDDYAKNLLNVFKTPIVLLEEQVQVTISAGISLYPQHGNTSREIINNAESALRLAKLEGGNHIKYFSEEVRKKTSQKLVLENDIRVALEKKQFVLFFQPKVDIKTKRVVGVEALIRWPQAEKDMIPPLEFIPIAEETNLIIPLGDWVLDETCQALKKLAASYPELSMAVNISVRQFNQHDFIKKIEQAIKKHQINPKQLDFEITESLLMTNLLQFEKQFDYIKNSIGTTFSLDDFGTGYSSLCYLANIKIDHLKIDQSFIKMLPESKHHVAIVRAIISLAKGLGMKTIAEGVENKTQWDFLAQEGCDQIQGFYFAHPLSLDELIQFLSKN